MLENVTANSFYTNIKTGTDYQVLHIAKHSETLDAMVIYTQPGSGEVWARPLDLFRTKFMDVVLEKRARSQGGKRGPGTISWEEHERAWVEYDKRYGSGQSAERINERGGFHFDELVMFLGHEPKTWKKKGSP